MQVILFLKIVDKWVCPQRPKPWCY